MTMMSVNPAEKQEPYYFDESNYYLNSKGGARGGLLTTTHQEHRVKNSGNFQPGEFATVFETARTKRKQMYLRGQVPAFQGPTGKGALTSYLYSKPLESDRI